MRDGSEPSHTRPIGGMGYVHAGVGDQLSGKGETAPRYTLAVLDAIHLLSSAANKATVCLLVGSAVSPYSCRIGGSSGGWICMPWKKRTME